MIPASSLIAATALALPETADNSKSSHHSKGDGKNDDLSPLAEYLLIAAGAIGMWKKHILERNTNFNRCVHHGCSCHMVLGEDTED